MSANVRTLTAIEARKLVRQPSTLVLAGILVVYLLVIGVSFSALLGAPEVEGFDRESFVGPIRAAPVAFATSLFAGTASIVVIVLAATIVGHEFSRGTLRTLLLAGATRRGFALSKLAVLAAVAAALALVGTAFVFGALAAFGSALGERLLTAGVSDAAWVFLGLLISFYGWASIAATATLWRGSLGVGIGTAVGLLLVGDVAGGLLAGMGDAGVYAGRLLPNAAFAALSGGAAPPAATWGWVVVSLAAYLVALPALAMRRLERVDVVAATRS